MMNTKEEIKDEIGRLLSSTQDGEATSISNVLSGLKDFINALPEEGESDCKLWLDEYKGRCDFYTKFIEYLGNECVGSKDGIIEDVANNFRTEFIGYVETEKEIDSKGNLVFKFKIDDKTYKANWQEDDNYAVCQWTGFEADDYYGYLLFPTFGFKKFFCVYYTC